MTATFNAIFAYGVAQSSRSRIPVRKPGQFSVRQGRIIYVPKASAQHKGKRPSTIVVPSFLFTVSRLETPDKHCPLLLGVSYTVVGEHSISDKSYNPSNTPSDPARNDSCRNFDRQGGGPKHTGGRSHQYLQKIFEVTPPSTTFKCLKT